VHVKIEEMKTNTGLIKNLELSIGKVVDYSWTEPMGPTPMPSLTTLRDWDMKLLNKYKPFYMEGLVLSGLKHFAPNLKTITLDNMYHPHASWAFPNASMKDWAENLKVMISKFGEGQ